MKKLIEKIKAWYKESNRDKHSYMGAIIYCTFFVVGFMLLSLQELQQLL